jgi:uncharacterized protein YdcH (DUF465 family)
MNTAESQDVKHFLLQSHDQYRELAARHHELDDRLHELIEKSHLSDSEQFEEVKLKKRKLALKDRMEQIVLEWARDHHHSSTP